MADAVISDEEQYANESFENESDNEMPNNEVEQKIPDVPDDTESEIDSDSDADIEFESVTTKSNSINTVNQSRFSKDCMPYDSSSDDEDDVVISETIAEINTEPMTLEDVTKTPKTSLTQLESVEKQNIINANESSNEESEEDDGDDDDGDEDDDEVDEYDQDVDDVEENYDLESDRQSKKEVVQEEVKLEEHQFNPETTSLKEEKLTEELENNEIEDDFEKDIDDEDDGLDAASSSYELRSTPTHVEPPDDVEVVEKVSLIAPIIELKTPSAEKCRKEIQNYDAIEENSISLTAADTEYEDYYEPKIEFRISSHTPSSFNTNEYGFHMNIVKNNSNNTVRMKAQPRKSWSFTNVRMREIERQNQILLKKILTQKPTYGHMGTPRCSSQNKFASLPPTTRVTSAAVNRKKQQRQIDLDNQVLKRKIEAISLRRPHL